MTRRSRRKASCGAPANMPAPPTEAPSLSHERQKPAIVPGCTVVLPDDIILEVLRRLPVKSILRFRAGCRSWAALLSSKDFCSLHMATSKALPREPKLLLLSPTSTLDSTEVFSCSLSGSGPGDDLLFTLNRDRSNSLEVVTPSTCCGLNLFFDSFAPAYYVCNAATRSITRLPPHRYPFQRNSIGLGFDAQTMEYKLVRLICWHNYDKEVLRCDVYTPGADHWRPAAGEVPFKLLGFAFSAIAHASLNEIPPVLANGFLHWLISPNLLGRPGAAIVLFSVAEETFGSVPSPPFWGPTESKRPWSQAKGEHLVVMDDQVCIVRDLCDGRPPVSGALEIWGLLDYASGDFSMNYRIDLSGHIGRELSEKHFVRVIGSVGNCRSGKKIVIGSTTITTCFRKRFTPMIPGVMISKTFVLSPRDTPLLHPWSLVQDSAYLKRALLQCINLMKSLPYHLPWLRKLEKLQLQTKSAIKAPIFPSFGVIEN